MRASWYCVGLLSLVRRLVRSIVAGGCGEHCFGVCLRLVHIYWVGACAKLPGLVPTKIYMWWVALSWRVLKWLRAT